MGSTEVRVEMNQDDGVYIMMAHAGLASVQTMIWGFY